MIVMPPRLQQSGLKAQLLGSLSVKDKLIGFHWSKVKVVVTSLNMILAVTLKLMH